MIVIALVVVGLLLFAGPVWISAPLGWVLLGYLLTRAWPGVRADLGGLRRGSVGGLLRPRRRRGAFL